MENYLIVLFKNKKKTRIINKFVSHDRAKQFYKNLIIKSNEIIFDIKVENGKEVNYELGLIDLSNQSKFPIYKKDEFGRNLKVQISDDGYSLLEIVDFKKEEKIFDLQKKTKITLAHFFKTYLKGEELKVLSLINNKVVLQREEEIFLFTLKNETEAQRFIDTLSFKFMNEHRTDCMFITDNSTPQRKFLLKMLADKGFDKKVLYRNQTTHPRTKA